MVRKLSTWLMGVLIILLGCIDDGVSEAPCYPNNFGYDSYDEYYTYDQNNRLTTLETYSGSSSSSSNYVYDKQTGRLTTRKYSDGRITTYSYDAKNRVNLIAFQSSAGSTTSKTEYTYNVNNQVTVIQYYSLVNGTLTKSYYYNLEYSSTNTRNYTKATYFNSSTNTLVSTQTYTYDTKPNPSTLISDSPTVQTNNVVKYTYTPVSGTASSYAYTYKYSDKGYPLSYTRLYSSGSTQSTTSYYYSYNNCH